MTWAYSDSRSPDAIGSALGWLEATLLGTVATAVAVIAVASVGFLMLTGRIDVRRAGTAVLACFILFGASTIAAGILSGLQGLGGAADAPAPPSAQPVPAAPPAYPQSPAQPYDPYAGAAIQQR